MSDDTTEGDDVLTETEEQFADDIHQAVQTALANGVTRDSVHAGLTAMMMNVDDVSVEGGNNE